ncbi:MAG: elongation factor G [Defluviitaleaceae bacterium]|nr:elongation factor G [Defluviitaleaceae bacterium]
MKVYSAKEIRNVAVLGHSGSGKTTVMEAALNITGVTSRMGRVEDGNTVSDYDDEEKRRRVSISSAVIPVEWKNQKINFIDAPGYFDFVGQVKEALAAADLVVINVSAKSGVEVGTEKAWEYATELGVPKMIFVNGMDDENADYVKVIDELTSNFGKNIAPFMIPAKEGGKLAKYADVAAKKARAYSVAKPEDCAVPGDIEGELEQYHAVLTELVAETDEALMDKFFNEEAFSDEELYGGIKHGIKEDMLTPVFCGAAVQNLGVRELLDALVEYAPAADSKKTIQVTDVKSGEPITIKCEENEPVTAFVFKTIADPYVGRLSIFRVYSGIIKRDTVLYNPQSDTTEKPGHLYVMRGKEQIEVDELRTGDIGAIAKLSATSTQNTLCAKERPVTVKEIVFPDSLLSMAIKAKDKKDEDKISQSVAKLLEEDKTLRFEVNKETNQMLLYGQGDSALDVVVNKLKNKYKTEVELSTPIVPYREMIKGKSRVQGKYKKQSGGHGQYGDVHMEFEPSGDLTQAYVFEERVFGGAVPRQYFPAVEKGVQESVKAGPLAAYPVVGIKCILVHGSYHEVDSSEMAFKKAAQMAFESGFMQAKPTILEPIASVVVTVPDNYTGDIMGDMNKRRGRIMGMEKVGNKQNISAEAPLSEMSKYTTDLRSMTQGRGSFTMKFDRYEEAPAEVQAKVIESRKKELESLREKE